jgi:hypothetical protein
VPTGSNASGNGVTFCIQNDPRGAGAIGGNGNQLGIGTANPITPSVELELNINSDIPGFSWLTKRKSSQGFNLDSPAPHQI